MEDAPSKTQRVAVGLEAKACVSPDPGRCRSFSLGSQVLQLTDVPTASQEGNVMSSYPQRRQQGLEKPGPCPRPHGWYMPEQGSDPSCPDRQSPGSDLPPPTKPWPRRAVHVLLEVWALASSRHLRRGLGTQDLSPSEPRNQHLHLACTCKLVADLLPCTEASTQNGPR